ncbi:MAG: hypothetical protein MUF45_05465 [Spirosomaceae bacterium]|jgi:hypothetical protein|nr:hypothetical protein [Spirosomataceae bacterium]
MKKTFFSLVFAALMAATLTTNAQSFQKGDKLLNAGIGLRSFWIPIGGTLEYGITDKISVGPSVYFAKWSTFDGTTLYLSARGSYHFNELLKINNDKLDVYAGAGVGYQSWSYKGLAGSYASGIYIPFHIGGRYYFSEKFGAHAEVGGGVATLLAGITLKF